MKWYNGVMLTRDDQLIPFRYSFDDGTTSEQATKIITTQYMKGSTVIEIVEGFKMKDDVQGWAKEEPEDGDDLKVEKL